MQEMFCKSGDVCDERHGWNSSETDNEDEPIDEKSNSSDDLEVDLLALDTELASLRDHEQNIDNPPEPFIELLKAFDTAPCMFNPLPACCRISPSDAGLAIAQLAKSRNASFSLQCGNSSNLDYGSISTITDVIQSIGTRVQLAENVFAALNTSKPLRNNDNKCVGTDDGVNLNPIFQTLQ